MKMFRGAAVAAAIAGSMLSVNAQAVNLTTDGVGEVAIAPYYTVRDGWQTLINLVNTQNVPVVVKVRLHEGLNSRDALDFTVALSAYDVWTGAIQASADGSGSPVLVNTDRPNEAGDATCVIPNIPITTGPDNRFEIPLRPEAFGLGGAGLVVDVDGGTGAADTDGSDRLAEGYVEFIVEGYGDEALGLTGLTATGQPGGALFPGDPGFDDAYVLATTATRRNFMGYAIENHDCATVRNGFIKTNILQTAQQFGEPIQALKFNFSLLNPTIGAETGNTATTWANFYNPGEVVAGTGLNNIVTPQDNVLCGVDRGIERRTPGTDWDASGDDNNNAAVDAGESCRNLIVAQQSLDFLEPSIADAYPPVARVLDDYSNQLLVLTPSNVATRAPDNGAGGFTARGIDAISATIQRASIVNEWSNNPAQGVTTDWILTQPTKAFYVDQALGEQAALPMTNSRPESFLADTTGGGNCSTNPTTVTGGFPGCADSTGAVQLFNGDAAEDSDATPYFPYRESFGVTDFRYHNDDPNVAATLADNPAANAGSCSIIGLAVYDRAEQPNVLITPDEPQFSPAPPEPLEFIELCAEANVVTFNGQSAFASAPLAPQNDGQAINRVDVPTDALPGPAPFFGWMSLSTYPYQNNAAVDTGAALPVDVVSHPIAAADLFSRDAVGAAAVQAAGAGIGMRGLPIIGFQLKLRAFANDNTNFASAVDHGFTRQFGAAPTR